MTNLERRIRRAAQQQNLTIRKSRVKTPNLHDHGEYMLVDSASNGIIDGRHFDLSLNDIEAYLTE